MKKFLAFLLVIGIFAAPAAADPLYNNSTVVVQDDTWMENATDPTLTNITGMLGRVQTYVIGEDPDDPLVGPLFTGILVSLLIIGFTGTSRSGVVAGGVLGAATAGVLAQSLGLVPMWLYAIAVALVALVGSAVFWRYTR